MDGENTLFFMDGNFQFYCLQVNKSSGDSESTSNFVIFFRIWIRYRFDYFFSNGLKFQSIFHSGGVGGGVFGVLPH